ncbi:MAG: UDP-3-O-(3-hydroxymyristoyl)glucosamine N-acyltransferase [Candidatus Marinimicrobia bacterium]|nr:UDP-3-O-(3-hydroxymyristoyl)glucosamine N-acyltransferase [Candidatus Neomarinimicrobiota bacterium]
MPDPRFYNRSGPFTLKDLAARCHADLAETALSDQLVHDISTIGDAGAEDIVYVSDASYLESFSLSRCGAVVISRDFLSEISSNVPSIVTNQPKLVFAQIAAAFYPDSLNIPLDQEIAVSPDASIGSKVHIAPGVVIGPKAEIGEGTYLGANSTIGPGVTLGEHCVVGANVAVNYAIIGDRVSISAGSQIGQEGFGFFPSKTGHQKIPQLGRVIINDDVDIGANSTVDRGSLGDTKIGAGTKIDNLVQIGHNAEIGRECIIVAHVGISGSCKIGNKVIIGGQAGLANHVTVGDGAQIAAKSGIMRDVLAGKAVMGYPAKAIQQFWREVTVLSRLTKRPD